MSIPLARFSRGLAIGFSTVVLAVTLVGCGGEDSKGKPVDETKDRGLSDTALPCDALSSATLQLLGAKGPLEKDTSRPGRTDCSWGSAGTNVVAVLSFKTPELAQKSQLLQGDTAGRPVEGVTWADETYFKVGPSGKNCLITARSGKVLLGVSYEPGTFEEMACQRQTLAIASEYAERNLKPEEG